MTLTMHETKQPADRKLNAETHKFIGKNQLQQYGLFSDTYNKRLLTFKNKLNVSTNPRNTISVEPSCVESITILNLVNSDNKLLSRMLASLASICQEMNLIVEEAEDIYRPFIFCEGIANQDRNVNSTLPFVQKTFENLQKVLAILGRAQQVINLLLLQLNALVGKEYYISSNGSNFSESMDHLADLLVSLLVLDNLVNVPFIKQQYAHYLMIIQNLLHDPNKFNYSNEKLKLLEKNMREIENKLLKGNILKHTINFCSTGSTLAQGINAEFTAYITQLFLELEQDEDNILFTKLWLQVNALVVFQWSLFGDIDKRNLKKLLELNKKVGSCTIADNKIWYPEEFLLKQIPSVSKYMSSQNSNSTKLSQISLKSQNLLKEINAFSTQASLCIVNIDKIRKQDMMNVEVKKIQEASNVLTETITLVKKINEIIKWMLRVHTDQNIPIAKSTLLALCRLIEILKCFQLTFERNLLPLIYIIMLISQHLTYRTLSMISVVRKNLVQDKSYKQRQLDVLSALSVCEQVMNGPNTRQRLLVAKLALSASGLSKETTQEIKNVINRLQLFSNYHILFKTFCNCSFLHEHFETLIPVYFSKLLERKADISRYYLMFSAFNDCTRIGENSLTILEDLLRKFFLSPLIQNVETNLRLQTHLHLALPPSDPFKNYLNLDFIKLFPVMLKSTFWSIKNETEQYLSAMFYNLTTVVLHDWQTYGEMRRLAHLQYNLETVEDNLPMQTIDQGLDVLEIMRNIDVFVSRYLYNLNSQVFVEGKSNNKHLNTIGISHVANSIRTHGIGIMNTTVNFTYQFLQKKFFVFSQFMFDEQIKSRLLRDLKFYSEHKTELNQMYPYERAEKFNYGIKKLGLNEDGLSYLDLFRKLISHIGNAMGYVRLIRSGGRRSLAEGTCFIPDFKKAESIIESLSNEQLPDLTKKAGLLFAHDLKSLVDNFEEATEYFKLLVDVFVPIFKDPKHVHLKNFFVIVPPLTINFVEHSLTFKERLKKNKCDAAFTDDGFAIGLAFIIELLAQEEQMNSLRWFHSVRNKFLAEREKINCQKTKGNKDDDKLQQTLLLTERRIAMYEKEFQLLYYNYSSARIFFQS